MTLPQSLNSVIPQKESRRNLYFGAHPTSSQQNPSNSTNCELRDSINDLHMTITDLQRLFANYLEDLGRLSPGHHPLRVLRLLEICRERPATQHEIIEHSGFSQS
jgi:hypothetical protein